MLGNKGGLTIFKSFSMDSVRHDIAFKLLTVDQVLVDKDHDSVHVPWVYMGLPLGLLLVSMINFLVKSV